MIGILITLFILSVLVIIHEAGHFFVARWFGIKVEEFGFGLPLTKAWWSKKKGETKYSFYPALIGGFVKLLGEDEAGAGRVDLHQKQGEHLSKEELKRAFFARPWGQRALVVVAGVVMNALLAFLIYYVYLGVSNFQTTLPLLSDYKFALVDQVNLNTGDTNPIITYVSQNSPAEKAGIKAPSRIVSVEGKPAKKAEDIIKMVNASKGKPLLLIWQEVSIKNGVLIGGEKHTVSMTPRVHLPKNEGPTGIAFLPTAFLSYETPQQKLLSGVVHPLNLMKYNFSIMKELIVVSFKKKSVEPVSQGVSGPIGIVALGGSINQIPDLKERFLNFLNLAGILSISLAVFNLFPIPGLDGGRFYLILIEGIFNKKLKPQIESLIHTAGMAVLILLILLVTFKDILQFFH